MKLNSFTVMVGSPDPERLEAFYRDTVGLEMDEVVGGFKVAPGAHLLIAGHSEVTGSNREPARFIVNLFVDDCEGERKRLETQGVEFIRKEGREYWGGIISTFIDPDGNYAQLIEFRPEEAEEE